MYDSGQNLSCRIFDMEDIQNPELLCIRENIARHLTKEGSVPTAIDGVTFYRQHSDSLIERSSGEVMVSLIAQGKKWTQIGGMEYRYGAGEALICGAEMPASFHAENASEETPFLSLAVRLDPKTLMEYASDAGVTASEEQSEDAVFVQKPEEQLLTAFRRLTDLLDQPERIRFVAPLVVKEIHYLLLVSKDGPALRSLVTSGTRSRIMMKSVAWIRQNFAETFRIEDLAGNANMSVSAFHRQFRKFTGQSPLQFQKQIRLYEARRLMLAEGESVTEAAWHVGYSAVPQFVREYKKTFGLPPKKSVSMRAASLAVH